MAVTYRAWTHVDPAPVGGYNGIPMAVGTLEFHAVCVVDGMPEAMTLCGKPCPGPLSGDFGDMAVDQVCKICDAATRP